MKATPAAHMKTRRIDPVILPTNKRSGSATAPTPRRAPVFTGVMVAPFFMSVLLKYELHVSSYGRGASALMIPWAGAHFVQIRLCELHGPFFCPPFFWFFPPFPLLR